jgi:uncharacterized protein (DUF58 family)
MATALLHDGHRVGAVIFAEEALVTRRLSRRPQARSFVDYTFADATNIEVGIDAARLLLEAEAEPGARPRIVVVSDAEATSHSGSDAAWGPAGRPLGLDGLSRWYKGEGIAAARRGALLAVRRCRPLGITVSVVVPHERSNVRFARELARAGGGHAACLRHER